MSPAEAQAALDKMKSTKAFDKLDVLTDQGNDAVYTLGGLSRSGKLIDGSDSNKLPPNVYQTYLTVE